MTAAAMSAGEIVLLRRRRSRVTQARRGPRRQEAGALALARREMSPEPQTTSPSFRGEHRDVLLLAGDLADLVSLAAAHRFTPLRPLLAGVEQALGVQRALIARCASTAPAPTGAAAAALEPAHAVLAADRAAQRARAIANSSSAAASARASCALVAGVEQERRVQVAVAGVAPEHASSPWRSPIATVSSTASASRSSGTATSSDSLPPRCAVTASETPSRQRHSARASRRRDRAGAPRERLEQRVAVVLARVGLADDEERRAAGTSPGNAAAGGAQRAAVEVLDRRRHRPRRQHALDRLAALARTSRRTPATGSARPGAGISRSQTAVTMPSVPSRRPAAHAGRSRRRPCAAARRRGPPRRARPPPPALSPTRA